MLKVWIDLKLWLFYRILLKLIRYLVLFETFSLIMMYAMVFYSRQNDEMILFWNLVFIRLDSATATFIYLLVFWLLLFLALIVISWLEGDIVVEWVLTLTFG